MGAQVTLARVVCVRPRGGRLRYLDLPGHRLCYNESGEIRWKNASHHLCV